MSKFACPVCHTVAKWNDYGGGCVVNCICCGRFDIGDIAAHELANWTIGQRRNLSGWIRDHQDCKLTISDLPNLSTLKNLSFSEKAERLMVHIATSHPKPGEPIIAYANRDSLIAVCWAQDSEELAFILSHYLIHEQKFLMDTRDGRGNQCLQITPRGWSYVDELIRRKADSNTAFIAMWFDDTVNAAWKAIDQGIRNAWYRPLRIDQKQHNNEITDEIIAEIRKSKLLIADLTGHRNGVYFEAGFAKGLGLEVIWLCRRDELNNAHFDTRQYNFIVWENDKLDGLSKAVQDRIEATIGRGPLAASA